MAVTAYTGPPGAGKSYALVSEVVVPGVLDGRRVLTNIDGLSPEAVLDHCAALAPEADLGEVVLFERAALKDPDFFPTESIPDATTVVKNGDLVVIDEWKLSFSNRGRQDNERLEDFLRWHRHLVNEKGVSTDVVIGTQLITDVHRDYRGVIERSFKFRKLSSVGLAKAYKYDVFEGSDQRKGTAFRVGNGRFKKEIFALYKSFETDGDAKESKTDGRATLFSKGFIALGVLALLFIVGGAWGMSNFLFGSKAKEGEGFGPIPAGTYAQPAPIAPSAVAPSIPESPYRIVGVVTGDGAPVVVVSDENGTTRLENARNFEFREGRPVSGLVDGKRVIASDRINVTGQPALDF